MFKLAKMFLGVTLFLLVSATAQAQGPQPQHTDPVWHAAYFNNKNLEYVPALVRDETEINYNWGYGAPAGGINADIFSARWTRYVEITPGIYRFTTVSDDGIRVWIDNDLIINDWNDHPEKTTSVDRYVGGGHHLIVVEYYENQYLATAKFSWTLLQEDIKYWRGEYFNNANLSGAPALVRDDRQIDFNWGYSAPAAGFGADNFSARWTRAVDFPEGQYRFKVTSDDGTRLWVNDHLLIDQWNDHSPTTYTGDIFLPGGAVPVKLEFYERGGVAVARLSWTRLDGPGGGEVIVDNVDAGFVRGGTPTGFHSVAEGYGGSLYWTRNNDWARPGYNRARWYPGLGSRGMYEVYVYIPERYTTTSRARYWVSHEGGVTARIVDQSANGDRWVSLGTYTFRGTSDDYVSLSDVTGETRLTRLIAFDAVKWVPR